MALKEISYKLKIPVGLTFVNMQFGNNVPIGPDDLKPGEENGIFEDTLKKQIIETNKMRVIVEVTGQNGLRWQLDLEIDDKPLPDNPIKEKSKNGRADHDKEHDLPE